MNTAFRLVYPGYDMDTYMFKDPVFIKLEVDALGVITISRGCFERCGSNNSVCLSACFFLFCLLYV